VTGWALSNDGIWRQHTWLLKGKAIVETTSPREKYYGFVLTDEEANQFWWTKHVTHNKVYVTCYML